MSQHETTMKTVTRAELHQQLDFLLRQVSQGKTHLTIEENGQPIVTMVSAAEYQRGQETKAFEAYGRAFEDEDPQEIERQAVQAIREGRARRKQSQSTSHS